MDSTHLTNSASASIEEEFVAFVADVDFPCLGAKAAFNTGTYTVSTYDELASPESSRLLARHLQEFLGSEMARNNEYATFVAVFREPISVSETEFERLLWSQLQQLHLIDRERFEWD